MAAVLSGKLQTGRYIDVINSGANPIPPYQCVSPLTAAQLITAFTAPPNPLEAEACRPSPTSVSTYLDRVWGISEAAARPGNTLQAPLSVGSQLPIRVEGTGWAMCGAVVARGDMLSPQLAEQNGSNSAPLINLFELNIPFDPNFTLTYNFSMVETLTISAATTGANALYCPLGYALESTQAKYQLVRVDLATRPLYA